LGSKVKRVRGEELFFQIGPTPMHRPADLPSGLRHPLQGRPHAVP